MSRVRALALLLMLLLTGCSLTPPDESDVSALADRSFEGSGVPGMVVVATQGEDVVLAVAHGRDGSGRPMTPTTPLRVASLTKTVTAVAVMQLVEAGTVRLDDLVVEHLPELEMADPRYGDITLQHLLDNTSGLRDGELDLAGLNRSTSLADYVHGLAGAGLASDPGEAYAYTNAGWEVLARTVEVLTGRPYDDHVRAAVFEPLGMVDSTLDVARTEAPDGFQELFGFWFPRHDRELFSSSSGADGWVTTAEDLGRWTRWLATGGTGEVLDRGTWERMVEHARTAEHGYGDGLQVADDLTLGHSGLHFTDRSRVLVRPEHGTGAAVHVNTGGLVDPTYAATIGLLDVLDGGAATPVGDLARPLGWGLLGVPLAVVVLAVRGVRRSRRWAARRSARPWLAAAGLLGLLLPAALLGLLPQAAPLLTNGTRTLTWSQASYLLLTPAVVLAISAVAGLVVVAARIRGWRLEQRDRDAGAQELGGREPEDGADGVAQVRG